jgi:hypothetical protein
MNLKTNKMKESKLISMTQYILDIDWLATKEFCDKYHIPHPFFTGDVRTSADQFLQIDAVKHRMFLEYAKFLRKPLQLGMFFPSDFDGNVLEKPNDNSADIESKNKYQQAVDRIIFPNFEISEKENSFAPTLINPPLTKVIHKNKLNIFWFNAEKGTWSLSAALSTIEDLTNYGLTYKHK